MGPRPPPPGAGRARVLGVARLPQPRRPVARRTLQRRLGTPDHGRPDLLAARDRDRDPRRDADGPLVHARPARLDRASSGPARRPAADRRRTATASSGATRSRPSPSVHDEIEITVERIDDGEVSPFLHDVVVVGDRLELRGPIGGYFVWEAALGGPLFLVAGGSGVVPLMAMLRHRSRAGSHVPTRLLFSSRHLEEIIYRDELDRLASNGGRVRGLPHADPVTAAGLDGLRAPHRRARCWPRCSSHSVSPHAPTCAARPRSSRPRRTRSSASACRPIVSGPNASARPAPSRRRISR